LTKSTSRGNTDSFERPPCREINRLGAGWPPEIERKMLKTGHIPNAMTKLFGSSAMMKTCPRCIFRRGPRGSDRFKVVKGNDKGRAAQTKPLSREKLAVNPPRLGGGEFGRRFLLTSRVTKFVEKIQNMRRCLTASETLGGDWEGQTVGA